jgi:hypothetical protein
MPAKVADVPLQKSEKFGAKSVILCLAESAAVPSVEFAAIDSTAQLPKQKRSP